MKGLVSGSTDGKFERRRLYDKQISRSNHHVRAFRVQGEYIKTSILSIPIRCEVDTFSSAISHAEPQRNPIIYRQPAPTAASIRADRLSGYGANSDGTKQDDRSAAMDLIARVHRVCPGSRHCGEQRPEIFYLREHGGKRESTSFIVLFVSAVFHRTDSTLKSLTDLLRVRFASDMSALTTNATDF